MWIVGAAEKFARRFPQEWRRAAMIPGLRHRITVWLRKPNPDPAGRLKQAGNLLGHGRDLTDDQWQAWAKKAFALVSDDTITA